MRLASLEEVARTLRSLMDGFGAPWGVAGGWALDLYFGRATRPHSDLELAVFRQDQARLHQHFDGWSFTARVDARSEDWRPGEVLHLPVHEIHATAPDEPPRSIEFLLNERDAVNWVFRRTPAVVLSIDRAIVDTSFGVPVLSPEIVLLFKAKAPRAKDEADFAEARSALSDSSRQWLRSSLLTSDPDNPWVRDLDTS